MKKIIGIIGVIAFAMAIFFNTNTTNTSTENVDLASLITIQDANAECFDKGWPLNNGKCTYFNKCFWHPDREQCDPTANW